MKIGWFFYHGAIVLMTVSLLLAQEFPIGAYIHKPDSAEFRCGNFTWAAMMTDFDDTGNLYYYQNLSKLKIIAKRDAHIYNRSSGQRLEIQAEQNPVQDFSENFFADHEIGSLQGDAWYANPLQHAAGYMIQNPIPYWEFYNTKATYIDSFRIKIVYIAGMHKPVVTLSAYNNKTGTTLASQTLYNDTDFGDNNYHLFALIYQLSNRPKSAQVSALLGTSHDTTSTDYNINVRVYWHGQVETWLDYVVINDAEAYNLYSHVYDAEICDDALKLKNLHAYPLLRRFMLRDEPTFNGFLPYNYVDKRLISVHPDGEEQGRGRGWTANHSNYLRFLQEAKPHELAVDFYPIKSSIPSPSLTNGAADSLGIPRYSKNYSLYTSRLQSAFDKLISFTEPFYTDSMKYGLRAAIEATKTIGSKKSFWFIPQLHGILWKYNGSYIPPVKGVDSLRNPTPNEIKAMVYLALAYGAKGIIYYPYSTTTDNRPGMENWNTGLVRREPSAYESNHSNNYCQFAFDNGTRHVFTGYQEKWDSVKTINAKLKELGPVLADSNVIWQNAANLHKGQIGYLSSVIEYLYTLNKRNRQDSYPSATFVEAGYLQDSNNWDYLIIVNRRCAPMQGRVDDRRKMKINLKKDSGNWAVSEIPAGQYWTLAYDDTFTTSLFLPGEGRVYRVAPRDLYVPAQYPTVSAALAAAMGGQTVQVSDGVYNESGTLTVKAGVILQLNTGAMINFAPGGKLVVYGNVCINRTNLRIIGVAINFEGAKN